MSSRCVAFLAAALTLTAPLSSQTCHAESATAGELSDALTRYAKFDYTAARRMLSPLADNGEPVAQEILGFIYSRGEGVERDDALAFRWFKRAADAGRPEAQFELGKIYRDGIGVMADSRAALFWFRRAADQGRAAAYDAIAELYRLSDPTTAFEWLLRAAEHGSAHAMYVIGLRYALGRDDEIEALKWLDLAYAEAIGSLREDVGRVRTTIAEHLMPAQVQTALTRSRDWRNAHQQQ